MCLAVILLCPCMQSAEEISGSPVPPASSTLTSAQNKCSQAQTSRGMLCSREDERLLVGLVWPLCILYHIALFQRCYFPSQLVSKMFRVLKDPQGKGNQLIQSSEPELKSKSLRYSTDGKMCNFHNISVNQVSVLCVYGLQKSDISHFFQDCTLQRLQGRFFFQSNILSKCFLLQVSYKMSKLYNHQF